MGTKHESGFFRAPAYSAHRASRLPLSDPSLATLSSTVAQQAGVLATADVYRVFAVLALLLIPAVLKLQYIPAPVVNRMPQAVPPSAPAGAAS